MCSFVFPCTKHPLVCTSLGVCPSQTPLMSVKLCGRHGWTDKGAVASDAQTSSTENPKEKRRAINCSEEGKWKVKGKQQSPSSKLEHQHCLFKMTLHSEIRSNSREMQMWLFLFWTGGRCYLLIYIEIKCLLLCWASAYSYCSFSDVLLADASLDRFLIFQLLSYSHKLKRPFSLQPFGHEIAG